MQSPFTATRCSQLDKWICDTIYIMFVSEIGIFWGQYKLRSIDFIWHAIYYYTQYRINYKYYQEQIIIY